MGRVLGMASRCIATHLIRKAGLSRRNAQTGAVTLIQRFGSALNLKIHFHMLGCTSRVPMARCAFAEGPQSIGQPSCSRIRWEAA
jgi:hypothetical protein